MRHLTWNGDMNFRPHAGLGNQFEDASHFGDALFDADQSDPPSFVSQNEAFTVVLNDHHIAIVRRPQLDYHRARFGVPGAVSEGLLNNTVEAGFMRVRELVGAA